MLYLQDANHLIVYPVLKTHMENDLFFAYIGVQANYSMTGQDLLAVCLEAWQADRSKDYRLLLIRENEEIDIPLNQNIKEAGLRNGDPLQIVGAA
ncbi:hypothetical protein [Ferviditalea candida]|uniref:Uncharacterized protein n=1 Tax=Ferviditalea candida TaxID=3108399 RepID=A0ABU5ZCP2_9BACL|nr:hypothetical protein [Paenibacillaceae bacterium T2]